MKEWYLSKTPFLTFVYISKCNINLPGYFGNSKKRFLWTGRFFAAMTWPPQCQCIYLLIVVFCYPAFHVWKAFASNHLSPSCNHGIILLLYLLMILLDLVVCKSTIINIIILTRRPTSIIIVPWRKTFPSLSLPSLPTFSLAQNIIWLGWGWAL